MFHLSLIISILLFMYAFFRKESKIAYTLLFIWMFILFAFNYMNADYMMYERQYIRYGIGEQFYGVEILWQFLCKFFYNMHLPYSIFLIFYSSICMFLLNKSLTKFSKYKSLALSCFFAFPFFLEVVQIRDFMAICIVIFGLQFLYNDQDSHGTLKYILCCFIATGFHYISLFYLFLIIVKKFDLKKLCFFIIPIVMFLTVIAKSNILLSIISHFIPISKFEAYFVSGNWQVSLAITLLSICLQLFVIVVLSITLNYYKKRPLTLELEKKIQFLKFVLKCNLVLLLAVPIYFYTFEFTRVFRGLLLLDYIAITNFFDLKITYGNVFTKCLLISFISVLFFVLILYVNVFYKNIGNILKYNSLLDLFFK